MTNAIFSTASGADQPIADLSRAPLPTKETLKMRQNLAVTRLMKARLKMTRRFYRQ